MFGEEKIADDGKWNKFYILTTSERKDKVPSEKTISILTERVGSQHTHQKEALDSTAVLKELIPHASQPISCKMLNFDGPAVSMNPRMDSSGTEVFLSSKDWSKKTTTTVISS